MACVGRKPELDANVYLGVSVESKAIPKRQCQETRERQSYTPPAVAKQARMNANKLNALPIRKNQAPALIFESILPDTFKTTTPQRYATTSIATKARAPRNSLDRQETAAPSMSRPVLKARISLRDHVV